MLLLEGFGLENGLKEEADRALDLAEQLLRLSLGDDALSLEAASDPFERVELPIESGLPLDLELVLHRSEAGQDRLRRVARALELIEWDRALLPTIRGRGRG